MSAHHVTHYRASKNGAWCACSCGWTSSSWTTISGSEGEFGEHLLSVRKREAGDE